MPGSHVIDTRLMLQGVVLIVCSALIAIGLAVGPLAASGVDASGATVASLPPDGAPFSMYAGMIYDGAGAGSKTVKLVTAPADKWLHITSANMGISGPNKLFQAYFYVDAAPYGGLFTKHIPFEVRAQGTKYAYTGNVEQMDLWLAPGRSLMAKIRISAAPTSGSGSYSGSMGVSGYMVPAASVPAL